MRNTKGRCIVIHRKASVLALLGAVFAATPAQATPIGAAHRAINASFRSQDDGFWRGHIASCRRNGVNVECRVVLTDPVQTDDCQGGTQRYNSVGIGVCESAT